MIDYFTHNFDLISPARKNFRPLSTNDDTVLSEQSDYLWDPDRSHPLFLNIPIDISSQAINTISIHKDYVKVIPFTINATPSNYNSLLPDRRGNNSLNSLILQQENLIGTRNLTQQDIQTPSHFVNEEIVETIAITTQQSISPIHPTVTTHRPKNPILLQVTINPRLKPPLFQNIVSGPQTTHPPPINTQNRLISQRLSNSVNFHDNPLTSQDKSENYPTFQQNRSKQQTPYYTPNYLSSDDDDYY